MANLNFQQPPRIPSASITNRNSSFTSSLSSGHVTPTGNMFPTANNSSYVATGQQQQQNHQQQLSPNRNVQMPSIGGGSGNNIVGPPMSTRSNSMFGGTGGGQQRAFAERRAMSGLGGGPMVSILIMY